MRLTKDFRERFHRSLCMDLSRIRGTIPHPMKGWSEDARLEFVEHILPDEVRAVLPKMQQLAYTRLSELMGNRTKVVTMNLVQKKCAYMYMDFQTRTCVGTRVVSEADEPEMYQRITDYVYKRKYAEFLTQKVAWWLSRVLDACTSVGQIKRCLPEFQPLYTPEMQQVISGAQRASRVPDKFPQDDKLKALALNAITLASVLPPLEGNPPLVGHLGETEYRMFSHFDEFPRVFEWQPTDLYFL